MRFVKFSGIILLALLVSYVLFVGKENSNKIVKTNKYGRLTEELRKEALNKKIIRREQGYAKSDNPDKYAEYLKSLKTGENGDSYEGNYLIDEFKKAKERLGQLKTTTAQLDWKERGPGNVGGRTRSLVIDPKDLTGNTWFAGSVSGGVWRTEDAGSTWDCLTPDIPNLATGCMTVSLDQPNVIYVGTGEGFYSIDAVMGAGIFKSVDNGTTWEQLLSTKDNSDFFFVNRIITNPVDVNSVIAATNSGIFKSTDGGDTWDLKLSGGRAQQIVFEKDSFLNQYAVINNVGVYKSTDGGDSWFMVKSIKEGRIEMAIAVSDPNIVYALTSKSNLYMSLDRGYNWEQDVQDPKTDFLSGQGWYGNSLVVSPSDTNILFVGGVDIHKVTIGTIDTGSGIKAYNVISDTSGWIGYKNFGGRYLGGGFEANDDADVVWNCNINFLGDSTQKAHRFVYDGNRYLYKNLVDVPFSVTKTDGGAKLNVSFIDENDNGVFDLTENSKEYIYIHFTDYTGGKVGEIGLMDGLNVKNLYRLLPVMKQGKTWDPVNLDNVQVSVSSYILKGKKITSEKKTSWYKDVVDNHYSHADHHGLIIDENNGSPFRILNCNDGGIAVSNDGGDNWTSPVHGYVTSQFYSVSKHPTEDRYMGGLQDNGTWFSNNSPTSDSAWNKVVGGDGFGTVWHSRKPEQMISSLYYNQLVRTDDSWVHSFYITDKIEDSGEDSGAPFITTIASTPDEPDLLFIGGPSGLWKSSDFGLNWKLISMNSNDYGYSGGSVQMEISKANPKIVWVGVSMNGKGKLSVSHDYGDTFTAVNNFSKYIRRISRIVSDPFDTSTVFVLNSSAESAKIIRSSDLGQTWTDITGFDNSSSSSNGFPDVATYSFLVMPHNTNELWAGTEIGLFISTDNGLSWHYSDNGLPAVCIWDMKVVGDQVVLGTHGRGVWSVTIPGLNTVPVKPYAISAGVTASNKFTVKYEIKSDFDSLQYLFGGEVDGVQTRVAIGVNGYIFNATSQEPVINSQVIGYKDGIAFRSNLLFADNFHYQDPRVRYYNDFESKQNDFLGDGYNIINSIDGTYAINSQHAYAVKKNYSYVLKYPVIVMDETESSIMTYEDIALVEKGENGTVFGDDEFWDYVVVEGSKDGMNWLPFADGYDARYSDEWAADINSSPSSDMFVSHTVNFQDTFSAGDTILIRFRLFSDANTVGWGWVIDNINIQKDGSGIFNKTTAPDVTLTISPNPATDYVNLRLDDTVIGDVKVTVYDLNGRMLLNRKFVKFQQKWQQKLSVMELGFGVRFVNVYIGSDHYTQRVVVK